MCRLLGYCARGNTSLAELMGERALADFTALSAFHGDGWGMAWYDGPQEHVVKSLGRAADEPGYAALAHRRLGSLGLVHLRWATPGLGAGTSNTHPFRRDGITMAHNGAIHPQQRLGELLAPAWERQLGGTTDSERYFLHVMSCLGPDGDMIAALAATAARIDLLFAANSLNAVFLAPGALYAVCWYYPERIPHAALATRGYDGPADCYFQLAYQQTDDAVIVASSGWPQDGWTALPNRHVLVAERGTLRTTLVPLSRDARPQPGLRAGR